jgi:hypothetical protein
VPRDLFAELNEIGCGSGCLSWHVGLRSANPAEMLLILGLFGE